MSLAALLLVATFGTTPPQDVAPERVSPVVRVVSAVGPAVVNVYQDVLQAVELPYPYNRLWGPQSTRRTSLGSGFIIDPDGYILTNAHVIPAGSEGIQVKLHDDSTHAAELINIDTDNDVALLKIHPPGGQPLPSVPLGTSSDLLVGETVIAIGNPLGNTNSVSTGIVSSLFRDVRLRAQSGLSPAFKDFIQIDAPINQGNSGGPLFNVLGEVIGVNFAVANEAQGIGFAIPIDRVKRSLVDNLLNPRLRREVVTGTEVVGLPGQRGVVLDEVAPDGPAARAGLRTGDRVVRLLDEPIAWEFDWNKVLLKTRPGDRVPIVVERGSRTISAELELAHDESPWLTIWRRLGLSVVDHPKFKGVRVERVDPSGPGAALGLREGDLIDGLDETLVDSADELYAALRRFDPGRRAVIHVWRGGAASSGLLVVR